LKNGDGKQKENKRISCNMKYMKGGKMRALGDKGFTIPDFMWEEMKLIIPKPKDNHPLGCHNPRIDD
jgi:hypothetical protein